MEASNLAKMVGKHFIMQYYKILHDTPEQLHKFYKENSVLSVGKEGDSGQSQSAVGTEDIEKKIASLSFTNCKVRISVVDAQDSLDGGVFLLVKGTLINSGTSTDFVQSFLLAPQQPSGYYVRNDIVRYLPANEPATKSAGKRQNKKEQNVEAQKSTTPEVEPLASKEEPVSSDAEQRVQPAKEKAISSPAPVVASPKEIPAAASSSEASVAEKPKQEAVASPSATPHAATHEATQPASQSASDDEKVPSSWAGIAARKRDAAVTPLQPQPRATPPQQKKEDVPAGSQPEIVPSLYISNLPFSCQRDDIEKMFSGFGKIKGLSVPPGKGYAFLDYQTNASVQKALAAARSEPMFMESRQLSVDLKKPKFNNNASPAMRNKQDKPRRRRSPDSLGANTEQGGEGASVDQDQESQGTQNVAVVHTDNKPAQNRNQGALRNNSNQQRRSPNPSRTQRASDNAGGHYSPAVHHHPKSHPRTPQQHRNNNATGAQAAPVNNP